VVLLFSVAAVASSLPAGAAPPPISLGAGAHTSAAAVRLIPPPRTFDIVAGGDLLTESLVNASAARAAATSGERYDFTPLFAPISDIVQAADLGICHMEIPIGRPDARAGIYGKSPFGGNLLLAPYEIAADLRAAGFDRCTTASNHSYDLGVDGIASTIEALDAAGLSGTGTARDPAERLPANFVVNGVTIANLSFTVSSNTGFPLDRWRVNAATDVERVAADVRAARAAGAEVVILSLHLKQEMLPAPITSDREFVTQLTSVVPIELIVQHGPHVVQPVERVNGSLVYWSVGNLLSGMGLPGRGKYSDVRALDGLLATVRFTQRPDGTFATEPWTVVVCNERTSRVIYSPLRVLADPAAPADLRTQAQGCLQRTAAVVADLH
jgi:poly-gamma-glutamate synthesis protein (capsule biosynthesis protein)